MGAYGSPELNNDYIYCIKCGKTYPSINEKCYYCGEKNPTYKAKRSTYTKITTGEPNLPKGASTLLIISVTFLLWFTVASLLLFLPQEWSGMLIVLSIVAAIGILATNFKRIKYRTTNGALWVLLIVLLFFIFVLVQFNVPQ